MPLLIIAESGSTKTDWRLLQRGRVIQEIRTAGINPYLQSEKEIVKILGSGFPDAASLPQKRSVVFYGAGCGMPARREGLSAVLGQYFNTAGVTVETDILGAARALCGTVPGVVSILGTGSNSCFYDGQIIADQQASLGFIAGDEGSGNHLGKKVLQYYAYKTFDPELNAYFEKEWGNDLGSILHTLYQKPFANRYLAGFVKLLTKNRGHYMVENILEDSFTSFFSRHIFKYRQSWKGPIHFTGSVSFEFQDVLRELCAQYELELGNVVQAPIDALVDYHLGR